MCGIAGYSLERRSPVDRTLAARALLAAIAERGADAVGYAHRSIDTSLVLRKQRGGADGLLGSLEIPPATTQVLLHVRDYTKGHPSLEANNHPVRHGSVVGVHNGTIQNDDAVMAQHRFERDEVGMTVDSEAIFALAEETGSSARALEQLVGTMAAAWLDERRSDLLHVARGAGRPLWLGHRPGAVFFASTERALETLERFVGLRLRRRELPEGTLLTVAGGRVIERRRFRPDPGAPEEQLPDVRAPQEGMLAMQLLAAMYTPT